jgi:uncharacterized protein YcbK (DUF882 family)
MNMKASLRHIFIFIFAATAILCSTNELETAAVHPSPFRFTGDGKIAFLDMHTGERLSVIYRSEGGIYDDTALSAIDHVLRCHGKSEKYPISQKLVELVDFIQDEFSASEVRIVSGYRSPEYNARLRKTNVRVAHDSLHLRGLAVDMQVPGVGKEKLGGFVRSLKSGGVGVYASSDFVHVDAGPIRDW